jgi:hypothetical protein
MLSLTADFSPVADSHDTSWDFYFGNILRGDAGLKLVNPSLR